MYLISRKGRVPELLSLDKVYNKMEKKTTYTHAQEQLFLSTLSVYILGQIRVNIYEPRHEISNNVVCATSKASDQPAHMRSLIRTFASCLNIL